MVVSEDCVAADALRPAALEPPMPRRFPLTQCDGCIQRVRPPDLRRPLHLLGRRAGELKLHGGRDAPRAPPLLLPGAKGAGGGCTGRCGTSGASGASKRPQRKGAGPAMYAHARSSADVLGGAC